MEKVKYMRPFYWTNSPFTFSATKYELILDTGKITHIVNSHPKTSKMRQLANKVKITSELLTQIIQKISSNFVQFPTTLIEMTISESERVRE